ncbi:MULTISPECIES: hypothetical protein [unclassified Caulobacter]|nr:MULTISPECIES: hypothetical protein [unclassified Caulobacter]
MNVARALLSLRLISPWAL